MVPLTTSVWNKEIRHRALSNKASCKRMPTFRDNTSEWEYMLRLPH